MRYVIGAMVLSVLLAGPCASWAQQNPTEDQIRSALTPAKPGAAPAQGRDVITPAMLRGPTRGLAMPTVTPPAPPVTTASQATPQASASSDACAAHSLSCAMMIDFASGSADLAPAAVVVLDRLGRVLSDPSFAQTKFRVVGHTDTVGGWEYNKTLSDERAQTVAAYLETHFHIATTRLEATGVGKSQLLVQTPDQTDEPRNRRVQVINIGT